MPSVTVVIPVRGRAALLREALHSLTSDPSAELEVIVVENGTREADERELQRIVPALKLVSISKPGRSAARNEGVRQAQNAYVAFLDSDDHSLPGRFGREAATLDAHPGATLCFGRVAAIGEDSSRLPAADERHRQRFANLLARGLSYDSLLEDCPIYTSATMIRRDRFLALGGYDTRLDAYEDLDLYLRIAMEGGLVACEGEPVALHRLHAGNTSSDALSLASVEIVRTHLRRAGLSRRSRRLLLEREVDALWMLGERSRCRRVAIRALVGNPQMLGRRRFVRRLVGTLLPPAIAETWRRTR
jgi:glycosyltransferase involved in cell wall biosynthesis